MHNEYEISKSIKSSQGILTGAHSHKIKPQFLIHGVGKQVGKLGANLVKN